MNAKSWHHRNWVRNLELIASSKLGWHIAWVRSTWQRSQRQIIIAELVHAFWFFLSTTTILAVVRTHFPSRKNTRHVYLDWATIDKLVTWKEISTKITDFAFKISVAWRTSRLTAKQMVLVRFSEGKIVLFTSFTTITPYLTTSRTLYLTTSRTPHLTTSMRVFSEIIINKDQRKRKMWRSAFRIA